MNFVKTFAVILIGAVPFMACTRKGSSTKLAATTNSTACSNNFDAEITIDTAASSRLINQDIQFRVQGFGCSNGYRLDAGSGVAVSFSSSTTFTRRFTAAQSNAQVSATIIALNEFGEPVGQIVRNSPVFSVLGSSEAFACTFEPKTMNIQRPVDAQGAPTQSPPRLNFQIKLGAPGQVTEITPPDANGFVFNGSPVFPSASGALFTYSGSFVTPRTGSFIAKVTDTSGLVRTCNLDVVVQNAPGVPSNSPFAYRGDLTGDGLEDILTLDVTTGVLWVAKANGTGGFTYTNFATIPVTDHYMNPIFADFNRDGKKDLLIQVAATRMWKAAFSDGTKFVISELGAWPAEAQLANINSDDVIPGGALEITGSIGQLKYYATLSLTGLGGVISQPMLRDAKLTVLAAPASVPYNGASNIAWTNENATNCKLKKGGVEVAAGSNGYFYATSLTQNTSFTLECTKLGTSTVVTSAATLVTVQAPPAGSVDFAVKLPGTNQDAMVVESNQVVDVAWQAQNVSGCRVFQGGAELAGTTANVIRRSNPIPDNTVFKVSCTPLAGGNALEVTKQVNVVAAVLTTPNATIDFGSVVKGSTSTTEQKITIFNPANRNKATGITMILPPGFVRTSGDCNPAGFELAPGASCILNVKFSPTAVQQYVGNLDLTYHDGLKLNVRRAVVPFTGNGIAQPATGK